MDDSIRSQLKQAYKLIKANQKIEALALLKDAVQKDPENADAWWLVAFAVPTPDKAVQACRKVIALKPDHAVARQFMAQQESLLTGAPPSASQSFPVFPIAPRQPPRHLFSLRSFIFLLAVILIVGALIYGVPKLFGVNWLQVAGRLPFVGQMIPTPRATAGPVATAASGFPPLPTGIRVGTQQEKADILSPKGPTPGTLEIGSADDYRFQGTKNAELIVLVKFLLPLNSRTALTLLRSDGSPLASSYEAAGAGTAKLNYTLPQDDFYVLRIVGIEGVAQGGYIIQMQITP